MKPWNSQGLSGSDTVIGEPNLHRMPRLKRLLRQLLTATVAATLVAGCGSAVTLEPVTIPKPLIHSIPAKVGLRMPANFEDFVHEEEVLGSEQWSIDLGSANSQLFTQLFGHMFDELIILGADDVPDDYDLDALIEPSIDAFEFSVPNQSKTESFAVWIRYRVKVFDNAGTEVANWPVSAYGKSQTESVSGPKALQRAAILAMRDAAALMIMKLDQAAGIGDMAADRREDLLPNVVPASTAPATATQTTQFNVTQGESR